MKKLAAVIALSAALATPAAAQYVYSVSPGGYYYVTEPRGFDEIYVYDAPVMYGPPVTLVTPRGVMSDPDPHIRSQIQRNYGHYLNMNQ